MSADPNAEARARAERASAAHRPETRKRAAWSAFRDALRDLAELDVERAIAWLEESESALRGLAHELREQRAAAEPTAEEEACFS